DKAYLINALTLFVEAVQADRFEKAFGYLTPAERSRMLDSGSEASADIRRRLKALRLSTLAQKTTVRLQDGLLEGIHDQLPDLGPAPSTVREAPTEPEVPSFQ
ncbi:MAG TPA: hypothetical protein VK465_01215, partial [Fibrobacteria bacterium]|nr:hypothetical protein [Fibrobacteria bacterium]